MTRKRLNILENISVANLKSQHQFANREPSHAEWIRLLRTSLRMSQAELAKRAKMPQSHIASIELGKIDPQISTLQKIFKALSSILVVQPRPIKPIEELLRDRARAVALKRLHQSMGSMALENQAPDSEIFKSLLEKRTNEVIQDKRERLWRDTNE